MPSAVKHAGSSSRGSSASSGSPGLSRPLCISKGAIYTYLHGVSRISDEVVYRPLQHLEEGEFNEIVKGVNRLRAVGIIRGNGSINYSLILQAIPLAARDEYLKQALLRFTVENFREDLRKMLGVSLAHAAFKWEPVGKLRRSEKRGGYPTRIRLFPKTPLIKLYMDARSP